jgi:hypothetical protein
MVAALKKACDAAYDKHIVSCSHPVWEVINPHLHRCRGVGQISGESFPVRRIGRCEHGRPSGDALLRETVMHIGRHQQAEIRCGGPVEPILVAGAHQSAHEASRVRIVSYNTQRLWEPIELVPLAEYERHYSRTQQNHAALAGVT